MEGKLDLRHRTIEIAVDIQQCEFLDEVDLTYCEFEQAVNFSGCCFRKRFNSGDSNESHTIYRKDLACREAEFEGPVDLNGALVESSAFFTGARFLNEERSIDFGWTSVGETLEFDGAVFEGRADFYHLKCAGRVSFSGATFKAGASFNAINCGDSAFFVPATFEGEVDFGHATFGNQLNCRGGHLQAIC